MGLDSDLLELDRRGIFPRPGESPEVYFLRGTRLTAGPQIEAIPAEIAALLRASMWEKPARASADIQAEASGILEVRFGCKMDWLEVYMAQTGYPQEILTQGFSMSQDTYFQKCEHVPTSPFCVLNRNGFIPHVPVLAHEMVHMARALSKVNDYHGRDDMRDYEELIADEAAGWWNLPLHFPLLWSRSRMILKKAAKLYEEDIGGKAGYALVRTSFGEVRQLISEASGRAEKPVIEWVCRRAEEDGEGMPNLRYMIIREHLRL